MRSPLAVSAILILPLIPGAASSDPMDLRDLRPRWVEVAFEVSPQDRPGQLDTLYSAPFPARLEPVAGGERVRVTLASRIVEEHLFVGEDPVPGSFSNFVWEFDPRTGEVLSAAVQGTIHRELDWGIARSHVPTEIRVEMSTSRPMGYKRPRRLLGQLLFGACEDAASARCTLVDPIRYDAGRGYVNAVGAISVRTTRARFRTRSFSPLGEAVFSERLTAVAEAESFPALTIGAVSAAPPTDLGAPGETRLATGLVP